MNIEKIKSNFDGLELNVAVMKPINKIKGIIIIVHGMAEHKERYYHLMEELVNVGYIVYVQDLRGHGACLNKGYFNTTKKEVFREDLKTIVEYAKKKNPNLNVSMFGHSMGTIIIRQFIKKYDNELEKVVLTGPPTVNKKIDLAIFVSSLMNIYYPKYKPNKKIYDLAFKPNENVFENKIGYISDDIEVIKEFSNNKLSGFKFTTSGYLVLFKMLKDVFKKWIPKNKDLKILLLAGSKDIIVGGNKQLKHLENYLLEIGYKKTKTKVYKNRRHDIITGKGGEIVIEDIINFFK